MIWAKSKPRLLYRVRERRRLKHYSIRTEQAYVNWVKRFILYLPKALHSCNPGSSCSGKRRPDAMGKAEVERFVTHLAVERNVALLPKIKRLALSCSSTKRSSGGRSNGSTTSSARSARRVPVVLSEAEVRAVLSQMDALHALMAGILYGAGLRLMECVRLRVKDVWGVIGVRHKQTKRSDA
jgi:integrase